MYLRCIGKDKCETYGRKTQRHDASVSRQARRFRGGFGNLPGDEEARVRHGEMEITCEANWENCILLNFIKSLNIDKLYKV